MRIGIDMDEVLADFLSAVIEYHNATYNTELTREQFQSYNFWEIWGGSIEEAIQKIYDFHKTDYFKKIKLISGAQETINILKKDNELYIITSRQDEISEATREWINKHFPNAFSDIIFTNNFSQNGMSRTKKEICDLLKIDLLIEDSADYALECIDIHRAVMLINCPWNKNRNLPKEIRRVDSWKEILTIIKEEYSPKNF